MQYLAEDVSCSFRYTPGQNEAEVLEWLLHLAISYLYEDMQESEEETGSNQACLDVASIMIHEMLSLVS